MRVVVVTNPSDDTPTEYLQTWVQEVIEAAEKLADTKVHELKGKDATKKNLATLVEKVHPSLILFNGHGDHDCIRGFRGEILIKADENVALLEGKIVHALACQSARTLGPEAIRIGGLAFLGYRENFKFHHYNKKTATEQKTDPLATLFLQPAFIPLLRLVEGKTVEDAFRQSQKLCAENLRMALTSTSTVLNTAVASALYHNLKHQVLLGEKSASF